MSPVVSFRTGQRAQSAMHRMQLAILAQGKKLDAAKRNNQAMILKVRELEAQVRDLLDRNRRLRDLKGVTHE